MSRTPAAGAGAGAEAIRVRFVIDEDARFEESNGEPRPLSEAEYAENQYWGCPNHPRGSKRDDRREHGRAWCGDCGSAYAPVSYAEYLAYYGNPEMHVYLGCEVERQCGCCGSWTDRAGLWNIDVMIDSAEYAAVRLDQWLSEATAVALPGYLGDVAREQIAEARAVALAAAAKGDTGGQ